LESCLIAFWIESYIFLFYLIFKIFKIKHKKAKPMRFRQVNLKSR